MSGSQNTCAKWTPFRPAYKPRPSIKELKRRFGMNKKQAKASLRQMDAAQVFLNSIYEVEVRPFKSGHKNWPEMIWLSIKRRDKEVIHDWRDLQRIKNELVGKENEAIELYPAESRLVDTANQYHLWVLRDPNQKFPIGWNERLVQDTDDAAKVGAKQRGLNP